MFLTRTFLSDLRSVTGEKAKRHGLVSGSRSRWSRRLEAVHRPRALSEAWEVQGRSPIDV